MAGGERSTFAHVTMSALGHLGAPAVSQVDLARPLPVALLRNVFCVLYNRLRACTIVLVSGWPTPRTH